MSKALRDYAIIFTCESTLRFKGDDDLLLEFKDAANKGGEVKCIISNADYGVDGRIYRVSGLNVSIFASATSIEDAVEIANPMVSGVLSALSIAANASIGEVQPMLAYDCTPIVGEHEFLQRFVPPHPEMGSRSITVALATEVVQQFVAHPRMDRLIRSATQYRMAIARELPGDELLASEHAWMAAEVLTKVYRDRASIEANDESDLFDKYGVKFGSWNDLDSAIRCRHIFQSDTVTYSQLSRISNEFEHGISDFGKIYRKATGVASQSLHYVRTAVLQELGLSDESSKELDGEEYREPLSRFPYRFQVFGVLKGRGDQLGPEDGAHPSMGLHFSDQREDELLEDGTIRSKMTVSPEMFFHPNVEVVTMGITQIGQVKAFEVRELDPPSEDASNNVSK